MPDNNVTPKPRFLTDKEMRAAERSDRRWRNGFFCGFMILLVVLVVIVASSQPEGERWPVYVVSLFVAVGLVSLIMSGVKGSQNSSSNSSSTKSK